MENRAERGGYIWTGIDSLFRRKLERRRARGRAELYGGETRQELDIEEDKDLKDTFFKKSRTRWMIHKIQSCCGACTKCNNI